MFINKRDFYCIFLCNIVTFGEHVGTIGPSISSQCWGYTNVKMSVLTLNRYGVVSNMQIEMSVYDREVRLIAWRLNAASVTVLQSL